ncbi:MAG: DHH family phosphoesterase [Lachnospiraceae bacterium]|nr:DHH family phosphoesterase [Lachnospiraceae bacterium]
MTRLEKMIQFIQKEHVYIQTHNFPDPDAIACAFGLQNLLAHKGIDATICYKGKIDRYNTLKLIELLGIELVNLEDIEEQLCEDDEIILVDAQKGNSNIIDMTGMEIICIDHHPVSALSSRKENQMEYRYTDIRPEVGACATIIASYFFENQIFMDERIATALTYAIRSDTDKLSRGVSKLDLEMLYRMWEKCDGSIIRKLENAEIYFEDLAAYSKAIESIRVFDSISFACVGENCPEALIASVSDFMLAVVEVKFSVVYAIQKNGIKLSVRSEGGHDAGRIISRALKDIGNGGGHAAMAGGFIPLADTKNIEDILTVVQENILEEVKYA